MIDKQQVILHFSKNASNYSQYAHVQKKMSDALIEFILENNKDTFKIKNILEIGCGTGYLTHSLIEIFPSAHITAVDIAPGMIDEIKSKITTNAVDFICSDIEEMDLENTYDIIISNATFQWFNHIPITIKKLYNSLNPKGLLCFSTFGKDTFCELKECFEIAKQAMDIKETIYPGQLFYGLNELAMLCEDALINQNIDNEVLVQNKEILEYEYFNNCKDFFYSIKKIGANNSNKNGRGTSPAFIKKVMNLYNENFRENDKVKATYHCLFYKMRECR
ncbi:malonyl-ACP O-methyltransferase BioC [Clostridium vincentii]|uniref:Malonyl-[acyl-carrier protein] O-methyltransferase n=1 Tax=Clostridium vincentii TaxID=52704 RepID=A0A2T0BKZ6_9CLOT|nr:malonyl-ACP O-methyltransferase BioC [Clostridium vincentii]PRR84570.1 Malonyl-[acyl-carrier protein] O-methyltransferase [Clostridium vincentii]